MNSLKTRGSDDFIKSVTFSESTNELIKISMTLTQETIQYNDLHKNITPLILRSKKRKIYPTLFEFLTRAEISEGLAIEWLPDVLQILKQQPSSEEALEVYQFLAQKASGKPYVFIKMNTDLKSMCSSRTNLQAQLGKIPEGIEENLQECVLEGLRTKSKWARALIPCVMKKRNISVELSDLIYS